jgi:hypothetical protein
MSLCVFSEESMRTQEQNEVHAFQQCVGAYLSKQLERVIDSVGPGIFLEILKVVKVQGQKRSHKNREQQCRK